MGTHSLWNILAAGLAALSVATEGSEGTQPDPLLATSGHGRRRGPAGRPAAIRGPGPHRFDPVRSKDQPIGTHQGKTVPPRTQSDEKYILDLVAEVLAEPEYRWQHRFPTLLGDPGPDGRRKPLPVDGYFPRHRLIVEYWERQHSAPVPIMDEGPIISGMSRGHQRRHYDRRRQEWADANDMRFVILDYRGFATDPEGRLQRDSIRDRTIVAEALRAAGVLLEPARAGFPPAHPWSTGAVSSASWFMNPRRPHQPFLLWKGREEVALLDPFPTLYRL